MLDSHTLEPSSRSTRATEISLVEEGEATVGKVGDEVAEGGKSGKEGGKWCGFITCAAIDDHGLKAETAKLVGSQ